MKVKTTLQLSALVFATVFSQLVASQIPHNSRRFIISDYFYPDMNGNYTRYRAHGFAQQRTSQNPGRLFFLPMMERNHDEMEFINEIGIEFDPLKSPETVARSIIIPIRITSKLPNEYQLPAIASALEEGVERTYYVPRMVKGPNNSFHILPAAQGLTPMLVDSASGHQALVDKQQEVIDLYSNYRSEVVSLSELEVAVILDNETIARRTYGNTFISTNGQLPGIEVVNPTLYQQNRIARGNVNILVSYKFRDAKTSTIDARFDARKIIDHFLEETQRSMTKSSSSGWQILGFGSRRKTVKSAFDSTVRSKYSGSNYESTSIEMFDASDDMIAEFERDFFPELSKQKAIDNHLAAAEAAGSSGNETLRDLHLKYASSLQNSDPNLEVDIAGAVASLSAGDYAGFIAKGVRWGDHRVSGNSSFRRVVHEQAEIESKTRWSQMRTVSVQHALTESVGVVRKDKHRPSIGICGAVQYNYPVTTTNMFGQTIVQQKQGMMPSCIMENSPAHRAALVPGMIVAAIGGRQVTTGADLERLLEQYEPGENLTVTIREYQGMNSWERNIDIRLAAGAPRP